MKAIYTTDETDYKEACFEIVHALPYFKKQRILVSLVWPCLLIVLLTIPAYTPSMILFMMPTLFLIIYFYVYQNRLFITLKRASHKMGKWNTENELTITSNDLVIKVDNVERKVEWENVVSVAETEKSWILYLYPNRLDFIIIKKIPNNFSKSELSEFNDLACSKLNKG